MSYFSLFQSPHPVRGATGSRSCWPPSQCHFNPRTPRGVRLAPHAGGGAAILISIHAPREGCDDSSHQLGVVDIISIHAPREGCDTINQLRMAFQIQFQSTHPARGATSNDKRLEADELLFQSTHPARGATACATLCRYVQARFQSTHPARGATNATDDEVFGYQISIHAPREGCDRRDMSTYSGSTLFQSTHPARGATDYRYKPSRVAGISIHAPREGCDC